MYNRAIKNGIIRNDLIMLLVDSMLRHMGRAASDWCFMRATIVLLVCVLLPGGVIPWLPSVPIVLNSTRDDLSCIYITNRDNDGIIHSFVS